MASHSAGSDMTSTEDKQKWPADNIERRKVNDLIPYARNSRTHSPAQVDQIAASIKEWGFTNPILIDETGTIIAGHGRVMAAQKLGIDDLPCMTATGWSEAQRRAYVIADNKLALNADWDMEALKIEMQDLGDLNFDLDLTGFDMNELAKMFDEPPQNDSMEVDDPINLYQLIVSFETEEMQASFFEELSEAEGVTCKLL
tara:strand:+ start:17 stop:616 length:600 start_codon:yes stop_codon:yes gene_type:complete